MLVICLIHGDVTDNITRDLRFYITHNTCDLHLGGFGTVLVIVRTDRTCSVTLNTVVCHTTAHAIDALRFVQHCTPYDDITSIVTKQSSSLITSHSPADVTPTRWRHTHPVWRYSARGHSRSSTPWTTRCQRPVAVYSKSSSCSPSPPRTSPTRSASHCCSSCAVT